MEEFKVESLHTESMVNAELLAMLGSCPIDLTLGTLERLYLLKSPYVLGGNVTNNDLDIARSIVPHDKGMKSMDFHAGLVDALATAFRAFEIIVPDNTPDNGRKSNIDMFSPEWLADMINMVCAAMPSLTYRQVLWEMPLALVMHLAVSTARKHGQVTERPADIKSALAMMKKLKEEKKI